ncbi:MAG: hypothetical protein ACXVCX_13480 [Ktedonobacterales bacterium]
MLYQVMIRARAQKGYLGYAVWEPFAGPTHDPFAAMQLVRQANQRRAEALVVQAEDADDLAELVRNMRAEPLPEAPAAIEIAEAARRAPLAQSAEQAEDLSLADELLASWDVQRWELERGAGGDHDKHYRFTLPAGDVELRSWLRLMVRYRRPALGAPES